MNNLLNHPNVKAALAEEVAPAGEVVTTDEEIAVRIIHLLKIYPRVSPSMLQVGMGTSLPPSTWKPTLERLIQEGAVKRENVGVTTPSGRYNTYKVISLAPEFASALEAPTPAQAPSSETPDTEDSDSDSVTT